jgi:hypothetical protein
MDLTQADLEYLAAVGIDAEEAQRQLETLRRPHTAVRLVRPCTIGDGIERLSTEQVEAFATAGEAAALAGRVSKFVPASGAATRMFKDLIAALQGTDRPSADPAAREFLTRLGEFPFAAEVRERSGINGLPDSEEAERTLLHTVLVAMRFAELPKALIPFHHGDRPRTAFEEQLLEAARYVRDARGNCRVHFTVPGDSQAHFEDVLAALLDVLSDRNDAVTYDVSLSVQSPSTDTLATNEHGEPFRNDDGTLLLRPAGHGALIRNLEQVGGDIVVVKNIDNVVPDESSDEVVRWKRALIGFLAVLQARVFAHVAALSNPACAVAAIDSAVAFVSARFGRVIPNQDREQRRVAALDALDRPLRACGFVRNEGEPGGAPFWVVDRDGRESVQIVESAQVNLKDPAQADIFQQSTHFNPVDLVCGLRRADGTPFDLDRFVDPDAAFVTEKTALGRRLVALERPGLWNGGMAGWNTVGVEVPAGTFAPVKTVLDLLRPAHQPPK